ncbi:NnrU family protein [Paraburkholderia tagetis]|uniref:NnrU family protein n=1 Tax=Paraburkholderia tagetis TaxID=2913261 RepID=A0A9X1RWY5_9BURK|nr:NnrU family protein [Paraburkholderia tagetis]MCG5076008.1 NnrU family protein [Paraburkholderia tagetis]
MVLLVVGLAIFIAMHLIRVVAAPWREAQIERFGMPAWRGFFALFSILGIVLIVSGYGIARRYPVPVWLPPFGMAHVTALLTAIAFVTIAAACVPGNHIKRALGQPFLSGVALWAFAHLLANGTLHAIVLFAALLVWALIKLRADRRRDREAGVVHARGTLARDVLVVVIGLVAWAVFAFWLHGVLIGVRPLG